MIEFCLLDGLVQSGGPTRGVGHGPQQRRLPFFHPQSCHRRRASGENTHTHTISRGAHKNTLSDFYLEVMRLMASHTRTHILTQIRIILAMNSNVFIYGHLNIIFF